MYSVNWSHTVEKANFSILFSFTWNSRQRVFLKYVCQNVFLYIFKNSLCVQDFRTKKWKKFQNRMKKKSFERWLAFWRKGVGNYAHFTPPKSEKYSECSTFYWFYHHSNRIQASKVEKLSLRLVRNIAVKTLKFTKEKPNG